MTKYLETKKNSLEDAVLRMKEKLVGGQKKLDKDKDGDIDGKDFAILRKQKKNEAAKPDFLDLDKDGNKKEPMKVAAKQAKAKKEEVEIDEGYESEVLKVLKDADVEGYFKMGKLYVSKRDARDAKKALEDSDEITKLPKMVMEDEKMKKLTKRQRQALARVQAQPKSKVSLPKMPDFMKPKKEEVEININEKTEYVEYKFKNRGDAMKAKRYFDGIQLMDFDVNDDNIGRGHLMVDAGNRDMTRYHKEIVKKFSPKVMKKESYEIGSDYAKHTLEVTPGQSRDDVDEMLGIAEKKGTSMREALAKMWGMNEGKNPFEKSEKKDLTKEGEHDKTLTGKKPTKIEVDPELKDK